MILYLDTSALLKLYVVESHSEAVRNTVPAATDAVTHRITYAEMRAGLARAIRTQRLSASDRPEHLSAFERIWSCLDIISADDALVRRAGDHAERFALRGFDSVHLAAAERAFDSAGRPSEFVMATFDNNLRVATDALGIPVLA